MNIATNSWVVTIGGGLAVAAISAVFKSGRQFWMRIWAAAMHSKPLVPTETFRIIQDVHQSRWGLATSAGVPSMQVVFEGHVTDISGKWNKLLGVEISKPLTHSTMFVLYDDNHSPKRPQGLEPSQSAGISAIFFVQPIVAEDGKPWKTTLIFVDQYNNRHKIKNCVFRALPPPPINTVMG